MQVRYTRVVEEYPEEGALMVATVCKIGVVVGVELGVSVLAVALEGEAVGETVVGPVVEGETEGF
jgi:hypothetical protein